MSMYNLLHGLNPFANTLLELLGNPDVGRFRDTYLALSEETGKPLIVVFTRNGGGNRDDYGLTMEILAGHPWYIRDYDDDFDCTYAYIEFQPPEGPVMEILEALATQGAMDKKAGQKMLDLIAKLQSAGPGDPDVKRAMKAMEPVMKQISEFVSKP